MAAAEPKSMLCNLTEAVTEWVLIVMLLINSVFCYLIFKFADCFCLKKPCLSCASSALITDTAVDLVCHRHATRLDSTRLDDKLLMLQNCVCKSGFERNLIGVCGEAEYDESVRELQQKGLMCYDCYYDDEDADLVESTMFFRELYENENVVEFSFSEDGDDEYVQKDVVHDDGRGCCLGHDESVREVATGEGVVESLIKLKKLNDDESYYMGYTAEGDLVMDLRRNLASIKTFSNIPDAVTDVKTTDEQQVDGLFHQACGDLLALKNREKAERMMELDEEDQPLEKSNDISTQSCLPYKTIEHVYEHTDGGVREHVCEQADENFIPASLELPSEHSIKPNGRYVPHASPHSPVSPNVEELPDIQVEKYQKQSRAPLPQLSAEDNSDLALNENRGSDQVEESMALCESTSVEETQHSLPVSMGLVKNEEDKLPDTPSSFDGAHNLYRNYQFFGKESATEETLDGSIISDFENGEGMLTIDKLKTALKVERKALHALYAELEEERNASAVAASQTMAMINRLQEEKASVQMEALQYQRMMEEQSEYDQEALQLLNELMVKREKEKQELERELEIYRKRVIAYETNGRLMISNRKEESLRNGSSLSCSDEFDSDGASIDLKLKNMNGFVGKEDNGNDNTPLDDVLHMEESLSHFEDERLSVLEQLKVLEENMFTSDDGDDGFSGNHNCCGIMNSTENGRYLDVKGIYHQERKIIGPKGKMLLPLFDATVDGNENEELSRNENEHDFTSYPHSLSSFYETENKNIYIEEEVDNVYERLQTLEADNEFLRHCFSSLKRGDKGLELLEEILQHLRNLRSFELEVRK